MRIASEPFEATEWCGIHGTVLIIWRPDAWTPESRRLDTNNLPVFQGWAKRSVARPSKNFRSTRRGDCSATWGAFQSGQLVGCGRRQGSMQRHVYVLASVGRLRRFYVGLTRDVEKRLGKHNKGGCIATKSGRPWRLRTVVSFDSEQRARAFERYLKTGSGRAFARRRL